MIMFNTKMKVVFFFVPLRVISSFVPLRVSVFCSLPISRQSSSKTFKETLGVRIKFLFQSYAKRVLIPFVLLLIVIIFLYILCLQMGACSFFFSVVSKVAGFFGVKALSFLLTKMGCSSTLAFVIGCAFRALVTTGATPSLAHWVLPGPSHQPHVAEEVPQEGPRDHTVATRSAPPVGIEVKQPLMGDQQREEELSERLNHHFFGRSEQINRITYEDLIDKQILIEKKLEMSLLSEEYTRPRILASRYEIRECLFYKEGVPLKEKTLDLYLKQIQSDPFDNIPYRKRKRAIHNFDLFFSK